MRGTLVSEIKGKKKYLYFNILRLLELEYNVFY